MFAKFLKSKTRLWTFIYWKSNTEHVLVRKVLLFSCTLGEVAWYIVWNINVHVDVNNPLMGCHHVTVFFLLLLHYNEKKEISCVLLEERDTEVTMYFHSHWSLYLYCCFKWLHLNVSLWILWHTGHCPETNLKYPRPKYRFVWHVMNGFL